MDYFHHNFLNIVYLFYNYLKFYFLIADYQLKNYHSDYKSSSLFLNFLLSNYFVNYFMNESLFLPNGAVLLSEFRYFFAEIGIRKN